MNWKMHRMKDGLVEISAENGDLIGYLEQSRHKTAGENEMIAKLITAAPKLFEACEDTIDAIGSLYDGAPDSPTRGLGRTLNALENVIAEARR